MIRFVDVRGQGCEGRFAWYDTNTGQFEEWFHSSTWDTFREFESDFKRIAANWVTASKERYEGIPPEAYNRLERYRSLAPEWTRIPPTEEEQEGNH